MNTASYKERKYRKKQLIIYLSVIFLIGIIYIVINTPGQHINISSRLNNKIDLKNKRKHISKH